MTERIHCDLPSCAKSRPVDRPTMLPDPWLKVEPLDSYASTPTLHFCSAKHAAEALAEAE